MDNNFINDLEVLLEERGWYLHKYKSFTFCSHNVLEGRIRFPCRSPMDFCYSVGIRCAAEQFIKSIEKKVMIDDS